MKKKLVNDVLEAKFYINMRKKHFFLAGSCLEDFFTDEIKVDISSDGIVQFLKTWNKNL